MMRKGKEWREWKELEARGARLGQTCLLPGGRHDLPYSSPAQTIAIVWSARNGAGGGRGGRHWGFEVSSCHENHLLHLNQGPGANGDSRRRPRGKRGSPISPGRSSTDNARILWQFHEKITPRSGPCRRLRSPIAPGCFHRNQSDSEV